MATCDEQFQEFKAKVKPIVKNPTTKFVVTSLLSHPKTYAVTLIQLGFEPLDPVSSHSIFGRKILAYPNVFKYMGHIRKADGFFGMYRGLGARLTGGIVGSFVTNSLQKKMKEWCPRPEAESSQDEVDGEKDDTMATLKRLCEDTSQEMIARCVGVVASHPFHVIMVRSMAQFVGGEEGYSSVFSSVVEIYRQDGILGFFAGIIPRLVGEALTIWLANSLAHVINTYLVPKAQAPDAKNYTSAICALMVTQVTYPFNLVSNVMAVNNCGLAAGNPPNMPIYSSWTDCWRHLSQSHELKRGSSLFWRQYKGPTTMSYDGTLIAAKK